MNEQLQQELAAWLGQLRNAADAGASFALEQAPLIIQEKVLYGRAFHTAVAVLVVLTFVVAFLALRRAVKGNGDNVMANAVAGGAGFSVFISFCAGDMWFPQVFQVWFAPRIYVIEWLAGLLK
jgi:uncharacterized membrane protein YjdF